MLNDLEKIILSSDEIKKIVTKLAKSINEDYKGREPVMIGILKGCHPFMSDFIKEIDLYIKIDYICISSYFGGIKSVGEVKLEKDLTIEVRDKDIIIVEDIVDSGKTIKYIMDLLMFRGAKSVEVVTLINKVKGRTVDLVPKYIGYEIKNEFIIGYGLDYKEKYRNLYAIGIPKKEIIKD